MKDTALLVISFGTSYHDTYQKTIKAIEAELCDAFPEADLFEAFTSKMIIKKIKNRDGVAIDTPEEAIERIKAMGYRNVICQTTHVINGVEFDLMIRELKAHRSDFETFLLGRPLLTSHDDFVRVVGILKDLIRDLSPEDACVFMGHGTDHHANIAYPAMNYYLERFGLPNCFMGTVEGFPTLDDAILKLQLGSYKRVRLSPFMIVAGDHARNDMAGDSPDSWKNRIAAAGFDVDCRVEGLGEDPAIRKMFIDHAKNAIDIKLM